MDSLKWTGYVLLHLSRGLREVSIYNDGANVSIWIDGELADDVPPALNEWADYFGDEYGNTFYEELYHYPGMPIYLTAMEHWVNNA